MSAFDLESEARAIAILYIACPHHPAQSCQCMSMRDRATAAIVSLCTRAVESEREACEVAVCERCASGHKPSMSKDFGREMHLLQGYPPRECKAAAIRARRQP